MARARVGSITCWPRLRLLFEPFADFFREDVFLDAVVLVCLWELLVFEAVCDEE